MYELHNGDCLDVMRGMDANTVDTILTDPPYGLSSGDSSQGTSQRIYDALVKIGFPDLYQRNAETIQGRNLTGVAQEGAALGIEDRPIGEQAGIGVPEGTIDLKRNAPVDPEVHNADIAPSAGIADGTLADERDAHAGEFLGDFVLQLGDMKSLGATGDVRDGCLAEAFFGGFAVPIFASAAPRLPGFSTGSRMVILGDDLIGDGHDAPCEAAGAPCIVTLPRTVNALMLRFDLRGRPRELLATYRADHLATIGTFGGPQLVRTRPAASGLASVAQPHRVRLIVPTADGADTHYWFHLWCPLADDLGNIIPQGGFMGKAWDSTLPDPQVWAEALRVAKPGALLLAFGGTRTWHRLAVAIEDAGWELKDTLMWLYGQGFPKSHDLSKAIDKAAGAERAREKCGGLGTSHSFADDQWTQTHQGQRIVNTPITPLAAAWQGWGTALKPAWEPVIVAQKPVDGTYAHNAEQWGVAGFWIDGGRIDTNGETPCGSGNPVRGAPREAIQPGRSGGNGGNTTSPLGRWPANLLLDEDAAAALGEVSRFFYCAWASRAERNAGLEGMTNDHPTIKPLALMRYLARLTKTPTGGVVLDPFMGSGTTGMAAVLEGRAFIGIELDAHYLEIAERRIAWAETQKEPEPVPLPLLVAAE